MFQSLKQQQQQQDGVSLYVCYISLPRVGISFHWADYPTQKSLKNLHLTAKQHALRVKLSESHIELKSHFCHLGLGGLGQVTSSSWASHLASVS